jgi:outer membrane protein assembly factor BamA
VLGVSQPKTASRGVCLAYLRAFVRSPLSLGLIRASVVLAALNLSGCAARSRAAALYPDLAKNQNQQINKVRFVGNDPFSPDTLLTLIDTQPSSCNLLGIPICLPLLGGARVSRLNVEVVRRDVARLAAFYRREGYFGTTVTPHADPADPNEGPAEDEIALTFTIKRGAPVLMDSLSVAGTAGIFDADSFAARLPIKPGGIFNLGQFDASADRLTRELQSRGYAYAEVLRNYSVDTTADRAVASLTAVPGPQVRIDSIIVRGAQHLGRAAALRQLSVRKGDLLRLTSLVESQRNLYSLEIVQLASVAVAPDSLQRTPRDSTQASILVNIAEAPVNQAEAGVGFGTVECLRTDGNWTNRSFGGRARRLNVNASLSKIGLGGLTQSGLGRTLCGDTLSKRLDYRVAADLTQPYFLSPRNQLTLNVYAERVSEPNLYQREAKGGQIFINHRLAARRILTASIDISRAKTIASPVLFCSAFQICISEQIDILTLPRYRNTLGLNYVEDHTNSSLDPTRGHLLRVGAAWATPWLSSSVTFTRVAMEAALYRTIKRSWVFASSLRLGNFFNTASLDPTGAVSNFLPPEERFYAGGATTVRGFARNELGPLIYVTDSIDAKTSRPVDATAVPVGGTAYGVANAELRFPSPVFRRQMRLAAFVDAGAISETNVWQMNLRDWRFTPGFGIRMATPVGPARVDVAYNPYNPAHGVLFLAQENRIVPVTPDFAPDTPNFFGRLRVHVAIGQAF